MDIKQNWMSDSRMSLLVDYYTEVPSRPYGSGVTRENVLPMLKDLDLGYLCIYVKGHSGTTTWNSALGTQHPMLAADMPKFFREITKETNTKLVLYYSGLLDGQAGIAHPDWRMTDQKGVMKDVFGDLMLPVPCHAICPLSDYFDKWVSVHLRELISNYDPDGIWVDGDWPGPCYCPRCQARFRTESGWEGEWEEVIKRPDFEATYRITWNKIEHEWRMRFRNFVKSLKADCLYSAGNVSPRREFLAPFDWRSGDFFSPGFYTLQDMARMMRWYGTLGVPYDAFVCDTSFTHARKAVASRSKPLMRMCQESATIAANGGVVGYWTYPLGNGAMVPSRVEKNRQVLRFLKDRDSVFLHTDSAKWTSILSSDPASGINGAGSAGGAHKAMVALHLSPDLMDETGVTGTMPYDLIIVPEQAVIDAPTVAGLEMFVRNGGLLISSGQSIRSADFRKLLGAEKVDLGACKEGHVFLKTCQEPTGIDSPWDRVEGPELVPLYPLYKSWDADNLEASKLAKNYPMHMQVDEVHPEPAGIAAAVMRKLGKGRIIHITTDIFAQYQWIGDVQMLRWLREILDDAMASRLFRTDAPSWVDVSLRRKGDDLLIHFVNQNSGRDLCLLNTNDLWVDEIPEVGPFACKVSCKKAPQAVTWEPGTTKLEKQYGERELRFNIPKFTIHGCARVEGFYA